MESKENYPVFSIYADESGKTSDNLIVGSIWFTQGYETYNIAKQIQVWRKERDFKSEFHFKDINESKLPFFKEVIDFVLSNSSFISFKAISSTRVGIRNISDAFVKLYYHLIVKGVDHENSTGRAILPRSLQLWKDAEEMGFDQLLIAEIKDRLVNASTSRFNSQLEIDSLEPVDSKEMDLIQIADLFTSSINRKINVKSKKVSAKDEFANYFLSRLNIQDNLPNTENLEDIVVHLKL